MPKEFQKAYLDLVFQYKHVISSAKTDLRKSKTYQNCIHLKDTKLVYQPQFPLKPDHQAFIETSLEEWLKLGVVRWTQSLYNSPIFCLPKKNGQGLWIVQDFLGLNTKTKVDRYSMKEILECIADIGWANRAIFTTIDLTSEFWQMPIHEDSRHLTTFTVWNKGQFKLDHIFNGTPGLSSFIPKLWKASRTSSSTLTMSSSTPKDHPTHLKVSELTLQRLNEHGL